MTILGWLILGLISGFVASKIVNNAGAGVLMDILIGIVGAMIGGWLFASLGGAGITGFNLYSMMVAIIGSIILLLLYHALRRRA